MAPAGVVRGRRERVTVVGAGAIGALVGARLALVGHDVTLCDRDEAHLRAIARHGVTITGIAGTSVTRVNVAPPSATLRPATFVFVAVKKQHLAAAVPTIARAREDDAVPIVSLQNGFSAHVLQRQIAGGVVVATVPQLGSAVIAPGVIEFAHDAEVIVGPLVNQTVEVVDRVSVLLADAVAVRRVPDIDAEIWEKLTWLAGAAAASVGITPTFEALREPSVASLAVRVMGEVWRTAVTSGVSFSGDVARKMAVLQDAAGPHASRLIADWTAKVTRERLAMADQKPFKKQGTGIWWDLQRGKRPELRALFDEVVTAGERLGHSLPSLRATLDVVDQVATDGPPRDDAWLAELARRIENGDG